MCIYFIMLFITAVIASVIITVARCGGIERINRVESEDIIVASVVGVMIGSIWPATIIFGLLILICYFIIFMIKKYYLFKLRSKANV